MTYPPYTITSAILKRVANISEQLAARAALRGLDVDLLSPHLRRENRIRTIHASLAIENNTLSLEQVTDIINGKAELVREHFCDGLGDCLPECPTGAISFEEREAPAYDEEAVKEAQKKVFAKNQAMSTHTGCPGSRSMQIQRSETPETIKSAPSVEQLSKLQNWPVQIKLAPVSAPYFDGAKLLIAADCTAYAYASFHQDFIRNKVTLIGCPKLDQVDYSEKLTAIIQNNNIQSVTIVRMEVPCCGGLEMAAKKALQDSGKFLPWQVITISIDGKTIE